MNRPIRFKVNNPNNPVIHDVKAIEHKNRAPSKWRQKGATKHWATESMATWAPSTEQSAARWNDDKGHENRINNGTSIEQSTTREERRQIGWEWWENQTTKLTAARAPNTKQSMARGNDNNWHKAREQRWKDLVEFWTLDKKLGVRSGWRERELEKKKIEKYIFVLLLSLISFGHWKHVYNWKCVFDNLG